ncbi:MAG: hypothetical protein J0I08_02390 [Rhizobiales bacterium]|nr:hypothetical protein [Hyphomicrobiales bacterium]
MDARVKPAHDADFAEVLGDIRDSGVVPQNKEAAPAIGRLDEGVYIPK